jgi:putative ABC transport system substrate-binding protein
MRFARSTVLATLALALLAAPVAAEAQPAPMVPRIGYLALNLKSADPRLREAFLRGLRDLGHVEGRTFLIEYRDAEGKTERLPGLAAELVALKVDIIVSAAGTLATLAAKRATTTLPIVFPAVGDPVAEGIVSSLARPGGNITGLAVASPELLVKSVEMLKQAVPGARRPSLLLKPDAMPESAMKERVKAAEVAAQKLGMTLQVVPVKDQEDFERAFSDMTKARADALTVAATPLFDVHRTRLLGLAARHRLPAVYTFRTYVEAGGLMSYGPDVLDLFRRAAGYVDKILKGAKPANLPVEQPTKFELVINLKTAKALGLTIPPSVLARADEVIQ